MPILAYIIFSIWEWMVDSREIHNETRGGKRNIIKYVKNLLNKSSHHCWIVERIARGRWNFYRAKINVFHV